ncbi:MAG: thiamine diphosphokinase [Rhodobacteraceae bacterium]|nr:thiamine diphosphokinase [Paracoccaceae bacterium]
METVIVRASAPVTLVGGSALDAATLRRSLAHAPVLMAADGGADHAIAAGHLPEAVIGDMDSISAAARAALGPDRLYPIAEQDSTDFDKCLRAIAAPFVIAVGFDGNRMDHALAAFNTLVRQPGPPCILLGPGDAVFCAPARPIDLALPPGARLSLFPMGAVTGQARGLRWPIDGIDFAPDGRIGTSNEVATPPVRLHFSAARMLVIVPATALAAVVSALFPG